MLLVGRVCVYVCVCGEVSDLSSNAEVLRGGMVSGVPLVYSLTYSLGSLSQLTYSLVKE